MKKILGCTFTILIATHTSAQTGNTDDLLALKILNATFINNFVTNDTASHSKIIHRDFVCLNSQGKYINRKEYLLNWANGYDRFKYWDYRDERISIFGTTALVRSQNKYIVVKEGEEVTGMANYTDVYIKENGKWQCIQAQIGNVIPGNYAGDETIIQKYGSINK